MRVKTLDYPKSYFEHQVFSDIESMREFYDGLSMGCFPFIPTGTSAVLNYASYVYSAIEGTLDSMDTLLKKGRINDAYVLVRKMFDDILVEIYIDVVRKEKYDWMKKRIVDDAETWLNGKIRIPKIKQLLKFLQDANCTKDIYPFFGWETYLKKNRELLDDSVHSNRYNRLLLNCCDVAIPDRETHLQNIDIVLNQIFTIHLSFIFHLNPEYLMSSDYMEYLEVGEKPPVGCESQIAPFAQQAFDKYIKPHSKLAKYIKSTCCLEIE